MIQRPREEPASPSSLPSAPQSIELREGAGRLTPGLLLGLAGDVTDFSLQVWEPLPASLPTSRAHPEAAPSLPPSTPTKVRRRRRLLEFLGTKETGWRRRFDAALPSPGAHPRGSGQRPALLSSREGLVSEVAGAPAERRKPLGCVVSRFQQNTPSHFIFNHCTLLPNPVGQRRLRPLRASSRERTSAEAFLSRCLVP